MAVIPPLVSASDLDGFKGAPFNDALVKSAAASIRTEAGWHIAPSITEFVWVEPDGTRWLLLPTLHLTQVTSVKDEGGNEIDGWNDKPTPKFTAGCLFRAKGWPCTGVLQVEMTHGYDECPEDLLPVVVDRIGRRVQQESLGSRSVTFFSSGDSPMDSTLDRYKIPNRP